MPCRAIGPRSISGFDRRTSLQPEQGCRSITMQIEFAILTLGPEIADILFFAPYMQQKIVFMPLVIGFFALMNSLFLLLYFVGVTDE
jgi:hypothetical protein